MGTIVGHTKQPDDATGEGSNAPARGPVTLQMVADAAGVSKATASRAINGEANVSSSRRAAVLAAASRLGFVPNTIAQSLVEGRTKSVGLLAQYFASPFYAMMVGGIEEVLVAAGYGLVVSSGHWNREEEEACIRSLRARRVDGIIVLTGRLPDEYLTDLAAQLPIVVTGRTLFAPGLHSLSSKDYEGALVGTRHLLELGHKRIAHITGDQTHPDAHERERGFRDAMELAGVSVDPALIVEGDYLEASGMSAVGKLLDRDADFTAIFAANDQSAAGAAGALHARGLRVPEDVSVVGFDGLRMSAFTTPPISTVDFSVVELGRRTASAMLQLLAGEVPSVAAPDPKFVVRSSARRL